MSSHVRVHAWPPLSPSVGRSGKNRSVRRCCMNEEDLNFISERLCRFLLLLFHVQIGQLPSQSFCELRRRLLMSPCMLTIGWSWLKEIRLLAVHTRTNSR